MNISDRQSGSILVPVLVVAIIIVAVLLGLALFSDTNNSANKNSANKSGGENNATQLNTQTDSAIDNATDGDGIDLDSETDALPQRQLTDAQRAAQRVEALRQNRGRLDQPNRNTTLRAMPSRASSTVALESQGETPQNSAGRGAPEQVAQNIEDASAELISRHTPDFSSCRSLGDAQAALKCAGKAQTDALTAAFEEHNALRASGDSISLERGGVIMQRVIDKLQADLAPFINAAKAK